MATTTKLMLGTIAAAAALAFTAGVALADHHFTGTWKVKDTAGTDFEIVLADDGTASANREGEGLKGKWTEKDGTAVITWDTGWTTKIAKDGNTYKKTAFEGDTKKNSSDAEKVK